MPRLFLICAFALAANSAYATPKVGDFAKFDTVLSLNNQTIQAVAQMEMLQEDSSGRFLVRNTLMIPGRDTDVQDEWRDGKDMISDEAIDYILANCAGQGGVAQTISVPAGTFPTCALPIDNEESSGTVFLGKVPFGVVRVDSVVKSNQMIVNSVLREYR